MARESKHRSDSKSLLIKTLEWPYCDQQSIGEHFSTAAATIVSEKLVSWTGPCQAAYLALMPS